MLSFNSDVILKVVEAFYEKATNDLIIGYHFEKIPNFEEHIPRIALFWETILIPERPKLPPEPPFRLIPTHKALGILPGQLGRWLVLFQETLREFELSGQLHLEEREYWVQKVEELAELMRRTPHLFQSGPI